MTTDFVPPPSDAPARFNRAGLTPHCARRIRRGFSLVEALVALSITALAGVVLLLSVESSLQTTNDAVERTIADGAAQRLLDEILTRRFYELNESGGGALPTGPLGGLVPTLGATTSELLGNGFELFDDVDDFAGHEAQPLQGNYGEVLGTGDDAGNQRLTNFRLRGSFFDRWRQRVDVYYVDANNHTIRSTAVTPYRAVEVFVERVETDGTIYPLAQRKRIVAFIPPPAP